MFGYKQTEMQLDDLNVIITKRVLLHSYYAHFL